MDAAGAKTPKICNRSKSAGVDGQVPPPPPEDADDREGATAAADGENDVPEAVDEEEGVQSVADILEIFVSEGFKSGSKTEKTVVNDLDAAKGAKTRLIKRLEEAPEKGLDLLLEAAKQTKAPPTASKTKKEQRKDAIERKKREIFNELFALSQVVIDELQSGSAAPTCKPFIRYFIDATSRIKNNRFVDMLSQLLSRTAKSITEAALPAGVPHRKTYYRLLFLRHLFRGYDFGEGYVLATELEDELKKAMKPKTRAIFDRIWAHLCQVRDNRPRQPSAAEKLILLIQYLQFGQADGANIEALSSRAGVAERNDANGTGGLVSQTNSAGVSFRPEEVDPQLWEMLLETGPELNKAAALDRTLGSGSHFFDKAHGVLGTRVRCLNEGIAQATADERDSIQPLIELRDRFQHLLSSHALGHALDVERATSGLLDTAASQSSQPEAKSLRQETESSDNGIGNGVSDKVYTDPAMLIADSAQFSAEKSVHCSILTHAGLLGPLLNKESFDIVQRYEKDIASFFLLSVVLPKVKEWWESKAGKDLSAELPPPVLAAAGSLLKFDDIRIHAKIAAGAFGVVVEASLRDAPDLAIFAMKLEFFVEDHFTKFFLNTLLLHTHVMDHPNILAVYGYIVGKPSDETDGLIPTAILMEMCVGSLEDVISKLGDQRREGDFLCALQIALDATNGVAHCNKHGFLHRDLKPPSKIGWNCIPPPPSYGYSCSNQLTLCYCVLFCPQIF